jgi:hypothetical protein
MKPRSRSAGARKVGRRKSLPPKAPSTQAHSLDHLSTTELKQQRNLSLRREP